MQHFYRPTQLLLILFVGWTFEQCLPAAATCYLSFWRNSVTIVCYCVCSRSSSKKPPSWAAENGACDRSRPRTKCVVEACYSRHPAKLYKSTIKRFQDERTWSQDEQSSVQPLYHIHKSDNCISRRLQCLVISIVCFCACFCSVQILSFSRKCQPYAF